MIIHEFNFEFAQNGLGDYVASFYNDHTLYGYSALSGQWANVTVDDSPYICRAKGFIGLVSTRNDTVYYNRFYVFNSLEDSWVELVPVGTHQASIVGEKTALVVRSSMLYAFDPNGRSGTYEYWVEFEGEFFPVSVSTNSTISNFSFNQSSKEISFNVTGPTGTKGFCDITIPADLMSGDFTIYIGDTLLTRDVDYTETFNGTHYLFSISYEHSSHIIEIVSTLVIPDFTGWLFLPFVILATLSALALKKRLRK